MWFTMLSEWGVRAAASPPTQLPAQYSPALAPGTTRFGMGRGGAAPLSATRTPHALIMVSHIGKRSRHLQGMHLSYAGSPVRGSEQEQRSPPSTMSTASLRSVARRPRAASRPGGLPGVLLLAHEKAHVGAGFPLRCCQRLSLPHVATLRCRGSDNRHTSGASSPVLSY